MIVGITGGMGCGKSTAAALFESRGFRRLDSDRIVRERVLTDSQVLKALEDRYGSGIIGGDGAVDRPALAARVFEDESERLWLEELTHPIVFSHWRESIASAPNEPWIIEVPLLFEKGLEKGFDFTVCVACDPEVQFARLERRGLGRALAGQRISKQWPLARKIELADFVLWNDGEPEFLEEQISRLIVSISEGPSAPQKASTLRTQDIDSS